MVDNFLYSNLSQIIHQYMVMNEEKESEIIESMISLKK